MAAEGGAIVAYIFTGEEERDERGDFIIPQNATHVSAHHSVSVIPARLFWKHPNIVELVCHAGVKRIEVMAFWYCPRLRRVIIPGVEIVDIGAFCGCKVLIYIECPKLERIGEWAFRECCLSNINLPSAKVVGEGAFESCDAMTDVKFGKNLEALGRGAFRNGPSLESITIPLKNGLLSDHSIFYECQRIERVDLVEGVIHETIAALHFEEWRNDMNDAINSINEILPNAPEGIYGGRHDVYGEKALVIRRWIAAVLRKIVRYKAEHRLLLSEAASTLQLIFPNDIVMNNIVPFLELPPHTFDGEEDYYSAFIHNRAQRRLALSDNGSGSILLKTIMMISKPRLLGIINTAALFLNALVTFGFGPFSSRYSGYEFWGQTIFHHAFKEVWAVIFLMQAIFCCVCKLWGEKYSAHPLVVEGVSYYYILACLAQIAWSTALAYEKMYLAAACMGGIMISLVIIAVKQHNVWKRAMQRRRIYRRKYYWLLQFPFELYLVWIASVASAWGVSVVFTREEDEAEVMLMYLLFYMGLGTLSVLVLAIV